MKKRDCLWNTEFEHCRKKTDRANALQKIVQELNCPELAVQDVKLKIKTIRTIVFKLVVPYIIIQVQTRPRRRGVAVQVV